MKSNNRRVVKVPHSGLCLYLNLLKKTGTKIWCTRVFHGTDIWTTVCLAVPRFISGPLMLLTLSLKFSSFYSYSRAVMGGCGVGACKLSHVRDVFSPALKPLFTVIIPYYAMKPGFVKTSSHKLRNYILATLVR